MPSKASLILSDMSPNITGINEIDHGNLIELNEEVLSFSEKFLKPNGTLFLKTGQGGNENELKNNLKTLFGKVNFVKPKASRLDSKEVYILAELFKPTKNS